MSLPGRLKRARERIEQWVETTFPVDLAHLPVAETNGAPSPWRARSGRDAAARG